MPFIRLHRFEATPLLFTCNKVRFPASMPTKDPSISQCGSLFWYLSLFVKCKVWHQYNERLKALALLNSPNDSIGVFFFDYLITSRPEVV